MVTDRDVRVLAAVVEYYVLDRTRIQTLCFPSDNTGRVTRRRLQVLVSRGLINRHRAQVVYPNSSPAGSVYYPSRQGCQLLAEQSGDDRYLLTPTNCPQPHQVLHWLAVSDTHIRLDRAAADQSEVELGDWVNEWDVVNKDEVDPAKRFRLYTILSENPRLICAPDAAFVLTALGYSKVFYIEQDRGTTGTHQLVARKIRGYRQLAARSLHANHFPETNVGTFTVLCVTPNERRRDALRRAFQGKDGAALWKFASVEDLQDKRFLFEPVWFDVSGDAMPLVNLQGKKEA